tara:strand:+ start:1012 stop:1647 length:636 start_codon:yes stop_codon:yes gene_type:complete
MGSLRHGKMEQAGARNGLKQTRISSKAPLTQTTYGKKEFTAEGIHSAISEYDKSRSSQMSKMTPEQLENIKLNDTNVVHTNFNLNKVNLNPYDNSGTPTSKGFGLNAPVVPEESISESTYTVSNPIDSSLNRSVDQSPAVVDVPVKDFRVNENNKNRKGRGKTTVTDVQTFYKPGPNNSNDEQQISLTEFNQAVKNYDKFDARRKEIEGEK